jgi:glyoxylase-like metal-dependent hydrolase (beta-lactamase superfamily II)
VRIGSDGVVLVNAGTESAPAAFWTPSEKLTALPIRYVIDANAEADFVGGNAKLAKAGKTICNYPIGARYVR